MEELAYAVFQGNADFSSKEGIQKWLDSNGPGALAGYYEDDRIRVIESLYANLDEIYKYGKFLQEK
jgi:hypothetical protein